MFQPSCNHPDIRYDGSREVYLDAGFRVYYNLNHQITVPAKPPVESSLFAEYLALRSLRHQQITEETDAILYCNDEERDVSSPHSKGRPYATGDAVAEILREMEQDPELRHYYMSPIGLEDEAEELQNEDGVVSKKDSSRFSLYQSQPPLKKMKPSAEPKLPTCMES